MTRKFLDPFLEVLVTAFTVGLVMMAVPWSTSGRRWEVLLGTVIVVLVWLRRYWHTTIPVETTPTGPVYRVQNKGFAFGLSVVLLGGIALYAAFPKAAAELGTPDEILAAGIATVKRSPAAVSAGPVPTPMLGGNFAQFYVESDFREVRIPPMNWFQFDPKREIVVRLQDGKEFHQRPDGTISEFVGGKIGARVVGFPDVIPGLSVWVRAYEVGPPVLVTVGVAQKKR